MLVVARELRGAPPRRARPAPRSADSGGISVSISERPIMSAAAKPVTSSAARLKRSMRASRSVTITRLPAVSRTASVKSRSSTSAACARTCSVTSVATPRKPMTRPSASRSTVSVCVTPQARPVLAHVGQLARLRARGGGVRREGLERRLDAERGRVDRELVGREEQRRRRASDDLLGAIAEHALRARVEDRDRPASGRSRRSRCRSRRTGRPTGGRGSRAPPPAGAGSSGRRSPRP